MKLSRIILSVLLVLTMILSVACNPADKPDDTNADTKAPDTQAPDTKAPDTQAPETQTPDTEPQEDVTVHEIKTADDLLALAKAINDDWQTFDGHTFLLMNDIDMAGVDWTPIGYGTAFTFDAYEPATQYFSGTFDGQNHVIKNLELDVNGTGPNGFIGLAYNATIKNLGIEATWNIVTTEVSHGSASLVGWAYNVEIDSCYVKNTGCTEGSNLGLLQEFGTLVGFAAGGSTTTVKNSYFVGTHGGDLANWTVGGIVGYVSPNAGTAVTVENCYSVGINPSANSPEGNYGGIISCTEEWGVPGSCTIKNCYTTTYQLHGTNGAAAMVVEGSEANVAEADITAEKLGKAFVADTGINNGLPILAWEVK